MAVAAQVVATATVDDLVTAVATEVMRAGSDVPDAVRLVLARMAPDADAGEDLIFHGLLTRTHAYFADLRRASDDTAQERYRYTLRTKHGRAARHEYLNRLWLEGADGAQKPVINFSVADCAAYISRATAAVAGWERKRGAMETAVAALQAHGCEYVTGLPADALAAVRTAMQEAWR